MNNLLSKTLIFAAGAAVGSIITWAVVKKRYEQITNEEIESLRELYAEVNNGGTDDIESADDEEDPEELKEEYDDIVKKNNYVSYSTKSDEMVEYDEELDEEEEEGEMFVEPYIIGPEDFDENGYDTESLYYYENGVVTDAISGEVIEDVKDLIGKEYHKHFGDYGEPDSVYVRNENNETDYEILRTGEEYTEGN